MTGILGKFQVEHDSRGARVITRSHELTSECETDSEIDIAIQMLKDDLDACSSEMKRRVALHMRGSLFEGWPSTRDEIVNS